MRLRTVGSLTSFFFYPMAIAILGGCGQIIGFEDPIPAQPSAGAAGNGPGQGGTAGVAGQGGAAGSTGEGGAMGGAGQGGGSGDAGQGGGVSGASGQGGVAGSSGQGGEGGVAGAAGEGGMAGAAGASGEGGVAGASGQGGMSGASGEGGMAGGAGAAGVAGEGGVAGSAGASGEAGAGGEGGNGGGGAGGAGTGGVAGAGGSAGGGAGGVGGSAGGGAGGGAGTCAGGVGGGAGAGGNAGGGAGGAGGGCPVCGDTQLCDVDNKTCVDVPGLVAFWKLDELGGTFGLDFQDSSGNNRDLKSVGSPMVVPSKFGNGLRTGKTSMTESKSALPTLPSYTISFWVKKTGQGNGNTVTILKTNSFNFREATANGSLSPSFENADEFNPGLFLNGKYQHILVAQDGNNDTGYIFIDEVLVHTTTKATVDLAGPLLIGFFGSFYFDGIFDQIRIYDRVVTPDELKLLANEPGSDEAGGSGGTGGGPLQECGGACVDTQSDEANCGDCGVQCGIGEVCEKGSCSGLVAFWKLDSMTSDNPKRFLDDSGNGNDLMVSGLEPDIVQGKFGNAMSLDVLQTSMGAISEKDDFFLPAWTLSLWIKMLDNNVVPGSQVLFDDSGYASLQVAGNDNAIAFTFYGAFNKFSELTPGKYQHVAIVRDIDGNFAFYLDGAAGLTGVDFKPLYGRFVLGHDSGDLNSMRNFNGHIDHVRLYNRALVNKDIQALFDEKPLKNGKC